MTAKTVTVGSNEIEVWPSGQTISNWGDEYLLQTTFTDIDAYHPQLIEYLQRQAAELRADNWLGPAACGTKIYHVESWDLDAARLIDARAKELFRRVRKVPEAFVDVSWASAYGNGDHCPPHSHVRAFASLVYLLDPGDADEKDSGSGRFWISDPRIAACCASQPGCMTTPISPDMMPGTLLIFPGEVVHNVWPYLGTRPRITMSWNINQEHVPGAEKYYGKKIRRARDHR